VSIIVVFDHPHAVVGVILIGIGERRCGPSLVGRERSWQILNRSIKISKLVGKVVGGAPS